MRHLIIRILCIALLATGSVLTVSAQEKKAEKATNAAAPTKALRHAPFRGTVALVDKVAKTITLEGEKHQLLHITAQTKITKNGQPGTLDEIAAGAKVTGSKRETAPEQWEAVSLKIIESKPATEAPAPKK